MAAVGATGANTSQPYTFYVSSDLNFATAVTLPAATQNVAYSQTLATSGGTGQLSFISGPLPAGLTLSRAGTISGTPTTAGAYTFLVNVTDSSQTTAARTSRRRSPLPRCPTKSRATHPSRSPPPRAAGCP